MVIPYGFDKVTAAIDRLLEAGIAVALNASFTPYNVCDIEAIYDFAKKRKLKVKPMVYMFPPIRPFESENKVLRSTEEEAGQALFRTKRLKWIVEFCIGLLKRCNRVLEQMKMTVALWLRKKTWGA